MLLSSHAYVTADVTDNICDRHINVCIYVHDMHIKFVYLSINKHDIAWCDINNTMTGKTKDAKPQSQKMPSVGHISHELNMQETEAATVLSG